MCGIVGIYSETHVASSIYDSLLMLQHRGQDAAGMVVCDERGRLNSRKSMGYVRDAFQQRHMNKLLGNYGIGHVRYPTAGGAGKEFAQPMYVNSPYGISIAHNGNLTNSKTLARELFHAEMRHLNTDSDSEVLLNIFAHELGKQRAILPSKKHFFQAVRKTHSRCHGAYAVVALITGFGLLAFRDPRGIRPLVIGEKEGPTKKEYIIASENASFSALGFKTLRDVNPGEAVFIDVEGNLHSNQCADNAQATPCIFEYVYLARPDSTLDEISVYKARMRMGQKLAKKIVSLNPDHDIDVVIPIPDSSTTAALQLAAALKLPYRQGFVKNRYIGRTFIMPGQEERKKSVRYKLVPQELEIRDKKVMIMDDSIVRGNTSREIVRMLRDFGAKKVYFTSACPPVKYPCFYGVDMPTKNELIAGNMSEQEIEAFLEVDALLYQNIDDLVEAVTRRGDHYIDNPCMACLDGNYIANDIDENKILEMEQMRNGDRTNNI